METVRLGPTDILISRLGFGGCPMGGHGWGAVSREESVRAVRAALDRGLNFFDTADTYGLGEGERTLGEALRGRRDYAVVATKFGVRFENGRSFYDNSPRWIRKALENSLRRLRTDRVDLYQIHYRDGLTPLDDIVDALLELRDKGLIRQFGLSNIGVDEAQELRAHDGVFVSLQDEFSLANRSRETDLRSVSADLRVTPLTWGSLGQGILTGKYDAASKFGPNDRRSRPIYVNFHGEKLARNLQTVGLLRAIADEVGVNISAVAIRWILDHLPGSVAIAGIKNVSQLDANLEALDWSLSGDHLVALDAASSTNTLVS